MRRSAYLTPGQAWWQIREKWQHPLAMQSLHQHRGDGGLGWSPDNAYRGLISGSE